MPMNQNEIDKPCHLAIAYCRSRGYTCRVFRLGVLVTSGSGRSEANALQAALRSERERMRCERASKRCGPARPDFSGYYGPRPDWHLF